VVELAAAGGALVVVLLDEALELVAFVGVAETLVFATCSVERCFFLDLFLLFVVVRFLLAILMGCSRRHKFDFCKIG
jgi:hypothetical protein